MLEKEDAARGRPDWPYHIVVGWLLAGLPGAVLGAVPGLTWETWQTSVGASFVGLGRHLALGLVVFGVVGVLARVRGLTLASVWGAFAVSVLALAALTIPQDIRGVVLGLSSRLGIPSWVITTAAVSFVSGGLVLLAAVTSPVSIDAKLRPARKLVRWLVIGIAVPLAITANLLVSPGFNPGAHLFLTCTAAIALSNAFAPGRLQGGTTPRLASVRRTPVLYSLGAMSAAWALWACFGSHPNALRMAYLLRPDSLALSTLFVTDVRNDTPDPAFTTDNPFLVSRARLPPVQPNRSRPVVDKPIVIVFSFDSLRADVASDPRYEQHLPNFHELRKGGSYFSEARAPAASTSRTMHAIATGRYFSQQRWIDTGLVYRPSDEQSVHWPALLSDAGAHTEFFPAIEWLSGEHRILQGFSTNKLEGERFNGNWVAGRSLTSRLIRSLEVNCSQSLLLWSHYLESHAPYAAGAPAPDSFTRYLKSLRVVDSYLGEIRAKVRHLGIQDRTLFVIMADHGEAFGEHASSYHGGTVYDEQIKVPLLFWGPTVQAQVVDEPASLLDIGPTVLDWMALPSPSNYMGESLVPALHGESPELERPVAAEAALKRAMLFRDGTKIIVDLRHEIVEIYDLRNDPGELRNLSDNYDAKYAAHLKEFRQYFAVHAHTRDGYRVPYAK